MTAFRSRIEHIDPATVKVWVDRNDASIEMGEALARLQSDAEFRRAIVAILQSSPFSAYCWETPPVSAAVSNHPFEFVLTDAPSLAQASAQRSTFAEHFAEDTDGDGVVVFDNLGGDATLIVPCPLDVESKYTHLAAFVRGAPEAQVDALFRIVGVAMSSRVSHRPRWLSTAGMGVHWLHLRVDSRPKYYRHAPYTIGRVRDGGQTSVESNL